MANSPILGIPLLASWQSAKETTINTMVAYLERAMNDAIDINLGGGNYTITPTDLNRYFYFKFISAGADSEITITPAKRMFVVDNTANGAALTIISGAATLNIPAGAIVTVMATTTPTLISVTDSTVMGGSTGATTFTTLLDTFPAYTGMEKHVLRVKNDLTGIESWEPKLLELFDVDPVGIADGYVMIWDDTSSTFKPGAMAGGGVSDAPTGILAAVHVASTSHFEVGSLFDGAEIDGVTLVTDMRVLLKNQTDPTENGIYTVGAVSSDRSTDMALSAEFPYGMIVVVKQGVTQANTIWSIDDANVSIGTTPLVFSPIKSSIDLMYDFASDVTKVDGMVMVWDADTEQWVPTTTSTTLPTGGTAGQALVKNSSTDFDMSFQTLVPNGGTTGQILAKTSNDDLATGWINAPSGGGGTEISINTQTASYQLVLADAGKYVRMNVGSANALTVPDNATVAFPVGTQIIVAQSGAGKTTLTPGAGVTLNAAETLILRKQFSTATLIKVAADVWDVVGDLEVSP